MKLIVFGGSGFLGSHVADQLTRLGHKVTIFDKTPSPYLKEGQIFIAGDILDRDSVDDALKGQEMVYHMAGISDIGECLSNPVHTIKFNILGTANILQGCVEIGVKKFIFASSAYVYSDSGSFYRVSKQSCELLIESYQREYSLDYVILRYGSLYGPRSDQRNSIFRILSQALKEKKIVYCGTGDEKREFIHVEDAAILSAQIIDPPYSKQNIILTGNVSITYKELLEMIKEMMGDKVTIEYVKKDSSTHYQTSPYSFNPKLGRKLSNNPHIDLGQGILNLMGEIHQKMDSGHYQKHGLLIENNEK